MPTRVQEKQFRAVYAEWCQGRLTQAGAAEELGVCERTFRGYVAGFRAQGSRWWRDRSRHRPSGSRAPEEERARLLTLYSKHYPGWNVRHFYERYRGEHGGRRSYTWVKNVLQTAGLVERRARNGTPKRIRANDSQESLGRELQEGMLLHQIASKREWVPGHTWDLILTVDDATNRVYSGFFVEERGIWSVFRGIRETLEMGHFDRLSLGLALPARLTARETRFGGRTKAQIARAMSELGIEQVQPKRRTRMRNTRMIGTLLGRLPHELAAEAVGDVDGANGFLTSFWTTVNESLAVRSSESPNAFVELQPRLRAGLGDVLCLKHLARVWEGRVVCWHRELHAHERAIRHLKKGEELQVHEYEDGSWTLFDGPDRLPAIEARDVE